MDRADAHLAELLTEGEGPALRFVRSIPQPRERVWRALHDSDDLRHWFPADIVGELSEGAAVSLPFWPDTVEKYAMTPEEATLGGQVLRWAPPELFEWTWDTDTLRFELAETVHGTTLTFTTWLADAERASLVGTAAGYHACLDLLVELLETGPSGSTALVDTDPLERRYAAHLAR